MAVSALGFQNLDYEKKKQFIHSTHVVYFIKQMMKHIKYISGFQCRNINNNPSEVSELIWADSVL